MATKLVQRHFLKGSREFELIDDHVNVRTKVPFGKEETLTVMLNVLDPEPVISRSYLEFNSRVNGEPLISLYLGRPDTQAFTAFVNALKQRAQEEYSAFAGLGADTQPAAPGGNVYDEPPDFGESVPDQAGGVGQDLDPARIQEALQLLARYLDPEDIEPLVKALESLAADPTSQALQVQVVKAFNQLGSSQGAVLTYAPYVGIVLSGRPFKW